MDTRPQVRHRNALLSLLSDQDFALLEPVLEPVELGFRKCLQSANRKVNHVYFPESGLASLVAIGNGERKQAEVAIIGREGMVGLPVVLGADRSPCEVFMQVVGHGHSVATPAFRDALQQSLSLFDVFTRFAHFCFVQAAYTALANSQGSLEERLARWLLMAQDRLDGPQLLLTHDFLALILGVRRAGVTLGLQHFEAKGLISTVRGAITILDRGGLREGANGLYGAPEAEFERLFG